MKTAAQLKKIIDDNNYRLKFYFAEIPTKERTQLVKRTKILVELKQYLETNPTEIYIKSEKKRIKRIILAKQSQFSNWQSNVLAEKMTSAKQVRVFCKETGITNLRKQLKNLNFILNENQEQPAVR